MRIPDSIKKLAEDTFFGQPLLIERLHGSLSASIHHPPDFDDATKNGYPAVLLLHGFGGNRHEHSGLFIKTAAALACAGMVALRIDFRGSGETAGNTREITINTQIEDAHDALDFLKNLPYVNEKRLGLVGFSFGGLTAAMTAGSRKDVESLVLWAPVYDMTSVVKRVYGGLSIRAVRARGYMQAGLVQLGPGFFDALEALKIDETVSRYDKAVLIIQGVADTVVPVDTAYQWKRSFVDTTVEIDLIQDADHAFTHEVWTNNVVKRTAGWFYSRL